jgi:transposase InsO family protein
MPWKKLLVWATGQIDEALRQKLEFVLEENRVYRALLDRHSPHWRLQDAERKVLAAKGESLGKFLQDVITIVQPQTLLKWHRQLVASKWDSSNRRKGQLGRPSVSVQNERLVLQFARENPSWGYDRIVGALANLGLQVSDQTVGNILQRHGFGPAPERKRNTSWAQFIRRHKEALWATDFFTAEDRTTTGLTTFYVLFFLHLRTRRIVLGGITPLPNESWMKQIPRNLTVADGPMADARFLLHDRDTKFSEGFDAILNAAGVQPIKLPPQSPNLNAFAERWVRSVKDECLDQLILFGERSLRHELDEYLAHYQHERNHQGLDVVIPFPDERIGPTTGRIIKAERLGGLLSFYYRRAA